MVEMRDMIYHSIVNNNSDCNIIFLHGWGCDSKTLEPLAKYYVTKYNVFLVDLPGFGQSKLETSYKLEDYIRDIEVFISNNELNNVVIIGHSFGGKIACFLKLKHPEYKVIALAPSIVNNRFKLSKKIKIIMFKVLKKLKLPIPKKLNGSKDYQKSSGYLRETFLNVHHAYLNMKEIMSLDETLIFGFNNDVEVEAKTLKRKLKNNPNIHFIQCDGDHFGYLNNILEIVRLSQIYIDGTYR